MHDQHPLGKIHVRGPTLEAVIGPAGPGPEPESSPSGAPTVSPRTSRSRSEGEPSRFLLALEMNGESVPDEHGFPVARGLRRQVRLQVVQVGDGIE